MPNTINLNLQIIENLKSGHWVGASILPHVKQNLVQALNIEASNENSVTSVLASNFYRKSTIDPFNTVTPVVIDQALLESDERWNFTQSALQSLERGSIQLARECNSIISDSLSLIESLSPDTYDEITKIVDGFVCITDAGFRSASHPHFLGLLFIAPCSPNETAASIIHELAHQELFLINFLDRLVNKSFDYNTVYSPFQKRERPPIGRLHSMHALYRMLQTQDLFDNDTNTKHASELKESKLTFSKQELTEFGWFLINEVY